LNPLAARLAGFLLFADIQEKQLKTATDSYTFSYIFCITTNAYNYSRSLAAMPRTTTRLSNLEISKATPKDADYTLSDGEGLYLLIKKNGTKVWRFNYYRPNVSTSKRALISFGTYPLVTLAQARQKRDEARAMLTKGIDPQIYLRQQVEQEAIQNDSIFENVAWNWFELKKKTVLEDTAFDIWRSLERDVLPKIGKTPVQELTPRLLILALEPVKLRGSFESLRRIIQRLNEIMIFARNTGLINDNPANGINYAFQKPVKQHQPTILPEQLPELLHAITNANLTVQTRNLIQWQLLNMVRPAEAATTRWSEIDALAKEWRIPAEKMKMKREHVIPLSPQAVAILEKMHPLTGHREYVFPSIKNPREHMNSQTVNAALKRMGYKGELVAHGLRALASTILNEQGFNADVIEAALAHLDKNEVRRAYNRSTYMEQRKILMVWWGKHIENSMN